MRFDSGNPPFLEAWMRAAKSVGRIIGMLLFVQLAGLILPFALLHPLTRNPRDFLASAAANSFQLKAAVFLLFANCALTIGISIAAWPVFRRYSEALALWLLVVSGIMFLMQAVDNVHILSMLSLSQQAAQAGGPGELSQAVAAAVGLTRRWAHFTELFVIDCWIFLLYSILYRFRLVPRPLAAFGLITVSLHFTGIPLPGFLGYSVVTLMGVPMALSHIALASWTMARGFKEGQRLPHAETPGIQLSQA
ncbi:MAG TPA: DUF4386 domain-containing protein [Pyrinomonadaceae bacterium]